MSILAEATNVLPLVGTIIAAVVAAGASIYAVKVQRRTESDRASEKLAADKSRQEDESLRANVSAQVTLTKDVLDNWRGIVANLGTQITGLHDQVSRLEAREHKCQQELLEQKAMILELRGKMANTSISHDPRLQ